LLKQGKEIGGTIIKDDNDNLSFFTCTKGKETSVEYDRLNYTYSYHTHPLVAFPELPHLPPSPFDIVGVALVDSYIENTYKCHLVISREGIYTIEVNKIYDVDNFREYMKNIHIKLLNFIRDDDIIFFDMARLETNTKYHNKTKYMELSEK
jgi:hypothetical protein